MRLGEGFSRVSGQEIVLLGFFLEFLYNSQDIKQIVSVCVIKFERLSIFRGPFQCTSRGANGRPLENIKMVYSRCSQKSDLNCYNCNEFRSSKLHHNGLTVYYNYKTFYTFQSLCTVAYRSFLQSLHFLSYHQAFSSIFTFFQLPLGL